MIVGCRSYGEVRRYAARHDGELPPYLPLPGGGTTFHMGERGRRDERIRWNGRGSLPAVVLDYVRENGALPPHD